MTNNNEQDLIEILGIEDLSIEEQEKILEETMDIVLERTLNRCLDNLPEEDADKINGLFEEGKEEEASEMLFKKIPNFDEIFNEEVLKFRDEAKKEFDK